MCDCHIDSCTLAYWLHYVFVILAALIAAGQIVHLKNVVLPVHVCGTLDELLVQRCDHVTLLIECLLLSFVHLTGLIVAVNSVQF